MLTVKQERFIINVFKGMTQRDAYIDAYHPNYSIENVDSNASRLSSNDKVTARLAELQGEVKSEAIAGEIERQEKLSELYRAETERKPTPKEIVMAIAEHNKMTRVYSDMPALLNDNRTVNIYVIDGETRELLKRVSNRTKALNNENNGSIQGAVEVVG